MHLNEWGLGGRGFGTFVSWFLLGGDIYTAYTFIAVPALVYAAGAAGFYALSYTIMVWPIVFIFGPRLWSVARARGYVSPGEFVRGRHGSQGLGLAVAATGILATMPYIALQLVGIESVLTVMGIGGNSSNVFVRDLPLIIAFAVVVGVHLPGRAARARADRVRQGHPDLRDGHRRDPLHPEPARRLGAHLRRRFGPPEARSTRRPASRTATSWCCRPASGPTPPWRSAPRWPCSCTRTRSPGCSPPSGAT